MKTLTAPKASFWNRSHYLDRMTLQELIVAYFQHYTIIAYLVLAVVAAVVWAFDPATLGQTVAAMVVAGLAYPLAWYVIHRWVLHGQWMLKIPALAATWKRIHYDHHQDPNHLEVLFGALRHTLPTVGVVTIPVGYAIGGVGGAAAAFGSGMLITCYNEFVHCMQHLTFKPRFKVISDMKIRHMAHHFHDEDGNYGITNFWWDRAFKTLYERAERKERSKSVFNLGYTADVAARYPWVADLSGGVASDGPRRRAQG